MFDRRTLLLAAGVAMPVSRALAAPQTDFDAYIAGVKVEARRNGIRAATLERAFKGVRPNQKVVDLDAKQPEFTLTWDQYRSRIVSDARIARGREMYARNRKLMDAVVERYRVAPGVIIGIWGLESNYGQSAGGFNVIEALATLAWDGRRAAFFRSELMDALKILDSGDVPAERMIGSYAGAMGQPQFMPDSFLKFAVDFNGNGHRDIWGDTGDVFASVANYLARSGWSEHLSWGQPVSLPAGFAEPTGRDARRTVAEWARIGVGVGGAPREAMAAIILPGGPGGEAFLAFHPNFLAIRRYNPSDFYCLSVGLIGDAVTV